MNAPQHHHGRLFELIQHGGYPMLFGMLFLCGLGLPIPEDVPLIASGVLIEMGEFKLGMVALIAWCAIIGGDCALYLVGRIFGPDIVKVPIIGRHINAKRLVTVEIWFKRWGMWVVAICRMVAGVRGAMVAVAGTTRFNFLKFVIADGIAAIVSGGLFVFLGYEFSEHAERIGHEIKRVMVIGGAVLLVGIAGYIWWRKYKRRRGSDRVAPPSTDAPPAQPAPQPRD